MALMSVYHLHLLIYTHDKEKNELSKHLDISTAGYKRASMTPSMEVGPLDSFSPPKFASAGRRQVLIINLAIFFVVAIHS